MPNTVDTLAVQINASARSTYNSIQKLSGELQKLSNVIGTLDTSRLGAFNANLQNLGASMQALWNTTKTADFTRVKKNLETISNIDSAKLLSTTSAIGDFAASINKLNINAQSASDVAALATSIGRLGSKSVQTATANLPNLADALRTVLQTLATAPSVNKNVIDMTNALANLASQGRSMGAASKSLVAGLNRSNSSMAKSTRHTNSLASAFGKLYASYFLVIRGVKAFYNSIKDTSEYIESFNYFTVTFDKIGKEWAEHQGALGEEAAKAYAGNFTKELNKTLGKMSGLKLDETSNLIVESGLKNLGMSLTELTQYAASIGSITNAIGLTGEISTKTAKTVTMLAADLGSLKNIDFDQVSANIQSALTGQARALYKYGIDVTNATLETYAANLEINKSVSEMTQAEKMQLRLLAILDQSKVAWGDLANTINSPSNMIRQLSNNLKECGTVLGQLFIPTLEKVLPVINGITIAIKRLLVSFAELLGIKLDTDAFGNGYSADLENIAEDLNDLGDAADKAKKGIRAFDELNVISSGSKGAGELAESLDLTEEITLATAEYEKVWNQAYTNMTNKAQEFANQVSASLEPLKKVFEDFVIGDYFAVGEDVTDIVTGIERYFDNAIKAVDWEKIGTNIGDFLRGLDWKAMLDGLADIIFDAIEGLLKAWKGSFDAAPVETAVLTAIGLLKFTGAGKLIGTALKDDIANSPASSIITPVTTAIKNQLGQIALGTLELGLGVSIVFKNIKSMADNKEVTLENGLGAALGTALSVIGTTKLITKIGKVLEGVSGGAITGASMGTALLVSLPITIAWVSKITADSISDSLAKEIAESNPWNDIINDIAGITSFTEDFNDVWEQLKSNLSTKLDDADANSAYLETIAGKYIELSRNIDSLTGSEKSMLQYYADELKLQVPGIEQYINQITGAWEGTEEQLNDLIEKQEAYYRLNAYQDMLTEAYKELAKAEGNLTKVEEKRAYATNDYNMAYNRLKKRAQEYYDLLVSVGRINPQAVSFDTFFSDVESRTIDLNDATNEALSWFEQLEQALADCNTEYNTMSEAVSSARSEVELWEGQLATAQQAVVDLSAAIDDGSESGQKYGKSYASGFKSQSDKIQRTYSKYTKISADTKRVALADADDAGGTYAKKYAKGIANNKEPITTAIEGLTAIDTKTVQSAESNAKPLGEAVGRGVIDGINSQLTNVGGAGQNLGSHVIRSFALVTQIQSPSKVFKKFGEYIDEGLAIGITKFTDLPTDATAALADAVNSEFSTSNLVLNTPEIRNSNNIASALSSQRNNNQQSSGFMDGLAKQITGALTGNNTQVTFQVEGDPNGLFKVVQKEAKSYSGRTGQIAFGI